MKIKNILQKKKRKMKLCLKSWTIWSRGSVCLQEVPIKHWYFLKMKDAPILSGTFPESLKGLLHRSFVPYKRGILHLLCHYLVIERFNFLRSLWLVFLFCCTLRPFLPSGITLHNTVPFSHHKTLATYIPCYLLVQLEIIVFKLTFKFS